LLENPEDYKNVLNKLGINEYNLVEVIKNEVPMIGFYNNRKYLDGFEGYYLYHKQKAIP